MFCCWRQRSNSITWRNRKSNRQNGGSIDGVQTQTIGQATGLIGGSGQNRYLLPQIRHSDMHKKCMVIDLDETLVHSSFKVSLLNFPHVTRRAFISLSITAYSKCRLCGASGDRWHCSSSLRIETSIRR